MNEKECEFIVDIPVTVRARVLVTDDEYYQRAHAQDQGRLIIQRLSGRAAGNDGVESVRLAEFPWIPVLQETTDER